VGYFEKSEELVNPPRGGSVKAGSLCPAALDVFGEEVELEVYGAIRGGLAEVGLGEGVRDDPDGE
jgi:hypothetical protein